MGRIRLLDREVSELIAAGEVIDRPASACKELLENAIDAGAHKIVIEIKNGGVAYLRVTDDGGGIAPEDVPLAFLRHATSKLSSAQELSEIRTMGFRGEALASIAAMARVELLTRTPGAQAGLRYGIEGGEETGSGPAGCPPGTSVILRDLFYNTPARMKFLKRDVSEAGAVAGVIEHAAVSHPDIAFHFIRDGKTLLQTPGNGRAEDAVYAVWGRDFFHSLVPAEYDAGGVRMKGFISKPAAGRGNRAMQHFFINSRPIRSKLLMAALEQGYRESMMKGKFPACVLDILLPPGVYDINVHPAKLEVRFADEKRVFDAVYYGVKSALLPLEPQGIAAQLSASEKAASPAPPSPEAQRHPLPGEKRPGAPLASSSKTGGEQAELSAFRISLEGAPIAQLLAAARQDFPAAGAESLEPEGAPGDVRPLEAAGARACAFKAGGGSAPSPEPGDYPLREPAGMSQRLAGWETLPACSRLAEGDSQQPMPGIGQPAQGPGQAAEASQPAAAQGSLFPEPDGGRFAGARLIGELFATYLLLECGEQLILIDKHAAHERLLYEKLKGGQRVERQVLLTPIPVQLPREQAALLLAEEKALSGLGFAVEDFGGGSLLIREIPTMLPLEDAAGSLQEIAQQLEEGGAGHVQRIDDIYHSMACKAAIKAHDRNDPLELQALIGLLNAHENVRFCPHGRPIAAAVSAAAIEKLFGRRA